MGYKYFLICFLVPKASKCNGSGCLSVPTFGTVCGLALQTGSCLRERSLI